MPIGSTIATIAALAGLASAGTTIGLDVSGALNPSTSPTQQTPTPTPPNAQQLLQQKALVGQQTPNVVGSTSGLASPAYDSLISQILAGTVGQPGSNAAGASATGQQFTPANSSGTNAAVNNQPVQLSDFVNSFTS